MGHCEIDKYANKSYQAMHQMKGLSIFAAQKRLRRRTSFRYAVNGLRRTSAVAVPLRGTRSQSGFAKQSADHENVKGLFSVGGTWDFAEVLIELAALGYGVEYALFNSSAFGVPQNRERIYIVGDLTGCSTGKILSFRTADGAALNQIIGGPQGSRIYGTDGAAPILAAGGGGIGTKTGLYLVKENKEESGPRAVIQPDKEKIWQNGRRIKGPDEYFERAAAVCSDSQLYKQAGNAVTVPVVRLVGQRIAAYLGTEK
jgi:DNA (cytosine-5)-methyltransferase 1